LMFSAWHVVLIVRPRVRFRQSPFEIAFGSVLPMEISMGARDAGITRRLPGETRALDTTSTSAREPPRDPRSDQPSRSRASRQDALLTLPL
jgi:hypothetical protein